MKLKHIVSGALTLSLTIGLFSVMTFADWENDGENQYYINENGNKAVGLLLIDDIRYKFDADGNLVGKFNGWSQSRSTGDYYYYIDGIRQTDYWFERGGVWSYFDSEGKMVKGALNIGGYNYNFRENGTWDYVMPVTVEEVHQKLLREIPDYYGGISIYNNAFRVGATDISAVQETVVRLYPNLPMFTYSERNYSFKTLKSVYDELKTYKNKDSYIYVNDYDYEKQQTDFSPYGFYYNVMIENNPQGLDYYDLYYTALNFADSVFEKYGTDAFGMTDEFDDVIYDEEDFAVASNGEGIDYTYFNFFYNTHIPNTNPYTGLAASEEILPYPDASRYPELYAEAVAESKFNPVGDLYYDYNVSTRVFINITDNNEILLNLYAKDITAYKNNVMGYYTDRGYTVKENKNSLTINIGKKTAKIEFIKSKYSINQLVSSHRAASNKLQRYRVYVDNSALDYYEDNFTDVVKIYCYKDFDAVKNALQEIATNTDNADAFDLIKKY